MIQKRIYFLRRYDDQVTALPAGKPVSWYQVILNAEYRLCSQKEYIKGLRRRALTSKTDNGEPRLAA